MIVSHYISTWTDFTKVTTESQGKYDSGFTKGLVDWVPPTNSLIRKSHNLSTGPQNVKMYGLGTPSPCQWGSRVQKFTFVIFADP